jgi:hypothetical protein
VISAGVLGLSTTWLLLIGLAPVVFLGRLLLRRGQSRRTGKEGSKETEAEDDEEEDGTNFLASIFPWFF